MNVKNRKCIRKLSLKSLYANRRRNLIAIFAIALTTLLFTSMFTIVLSLNASYETYQFRQVGGYAHGTFKDVSPEQAERIATHPKVKAVGARKAIGITADGVFSKTPAEISYMDANCTKWSYATPTTGRMPESGKEVAMDTTALQLLGVTPELGAEVTVSYSITDKDQTGFTVTDTFTLVGYWDYDELMPVHYINISRDYADAIEAQVVKAGLQPFRTDLNVMLASGTNIQGQMEQVDTDLDYTWDSYTEPNSVRIGVNWGYTSSQLESQLDPELIIAIAAFLLLVVVSLALSVTLFNALCAIVGGFSMEKYVSSMTCALVELPYSMSYRYDGAGYDAVLSVDTAQRDSGGAAIPMLYLFDTADEADEAEAEQYLSKLTAGEFSPLMYESKATARSEFAQFRQMFLLIGGILCAIIGLVGLLNFFNAMMTGILSRRREFAVLQAVGMTNRQLKTMLIYEGLFYAMSSVAAAFILSLAVGPLAGKMLGSMFWFFEYRFTILPVLLTIPVFLLLGWLIPCMMYDNAAKCSVVEQLRDAQ